MRKKRTAAQTLSLPFRLIYIKLSGVIWVSAAVILLALSIYTPQSLEKPRAALLDILTPVIQTVSAPFSSLSNKISGMTEIGRLKAENIKLTEENARLREWYQTALTLQAENQSLREFLNVKAESDRAYLTTRVISDNGGRFVKSLLVPAGKKDGVAKGQAVITDKGMVGRIVNAGQNNARILLITDLNSRIPVMIEETHHRAILSGQNENLLALDHLPKDSGLSIGSRIVTSGHEGILPPNIPVGIVTEIGENKVSVAPLTDMQSIHYVQIIAYENESEDGLLLQEDE